MKANVEKKVKETMTDLMTPSVGSWASIIVGHIFNDVAEELGYLLGEDICEADVTTEAVQEYMGEVLDR